MRMHGWKLDMSVHHLVNLVVDPGHFTRNRGMVGMMTSIWLFNIAMENPANKCK